MNFKLDENLCIVMSTGNLPSSEEAEFYELFKGKKKPFGRRKQFRISEGKKAPKLAVLKNRRLDKIEKMAKMFPADPEILMGIEEWRGFEENRESLKNILSNMSRFIVRLQGQI